MGSLRASSVSAGPNYQLRPGGTTGEGLDSWRFFVACGLRIEPE
ncbi:MAG: hypothetical protein R3E53_00500 [Myxococcota bacterium]